MLYSVSFNQYQRITRVEYMLDPNFDHKPSRDVRRLIASVGMGVALIMILGVAVYSTHAGILPGISHLSPGPASRPAGASNAQVHSLCDTPSHPKGDSNASIHSGGLVRTFFVHLAPSYGEQPQPLVINYHGYNNTAQRTAKQTSMGAEADRAGFILVFPQAVDSPPSWNAGIGAFGPTGDANDVRFTHDLISYFEHNYCVDAHRIYVAGYSLGGGMAYRVACSLSNQIAAFATVEGAFYRIPGGCNPSRPIPLLEIHGQADRLAPYNGNPYMGMAAAQVYLNFWLAQDKCKSTTTVVFQKADVTGIEWPHCAHGVVIQHYRISDGGHTWPGSSPQPSLGYTTQTIDANVVIWNFVSQFRT
jgi:polyhydroxybutyrate depolymerase